jgi:hypothetical protein
MTARELWDGLREDARDWAEGRSALLRLPLLAYLLYAGIAHYRSGFTGDYRSWFAGITLGFHELGHLLFSGLGRTWMLLGGSILQLLIPAAAGVYLLFRQRDWFGLAVCMGWLSTSLFELAVYMDDANRLNLPLVGFGEEVLHDWETLLTEAHLLNHAQTIAQVTQLLAVFALAGALALGGWLLFVMWQSRKSMVVRVRAKHS